MQYAEFVSMIARAGAREDTAERLAGATLRTLAERISSQEARNLAAQLPRELQQPLADAGDAAEPFPKDEFIRRVCERAELPGNGVEQGVRAVFSALSAAVSAGEMEDVAAQLSEDYRPLVSAAERG